MKYVGLVTIEENNDVEIIKRFDLPLNKQTMSSISIDSYITFEGFKYKVLSIMTDFDLDVVFIRLKEI
ncbi:MAG: hypothetical protein ACPG9K_01020 [Poseidonibacter sp.]